LMASILTGVFDYKLMQDEHNLVQAMKWLNKNYPFVDLIFTLDGNGIQTSKNISHRLHDHGNGIGVDRRHRPYFRKAANSDSVIVTEPYLSTSSHKLCISSAVRCLHQDGSVKGILVVDIDLADAIEFLMGDRKRKKLQPFFVSVYLLIVTGLFIVVGILLFSAGLEIATVVDDATHKNLHLKPFGIIIFLTLALAVFDLGKTTLEEEVLMHKDIFRHSSTRRTITRFIAAILIAVSIESLLLMFKSVLESPEHLTNAVAMMAAAIGLLVGLGLYVYLGARAELILKKSINYQKDNN
ncbi:MAG: general glycosylation pathway protein, partial [Gammaproteobacteria bacterium]